MVKSAYFKSTIRMFKRHFARLLNLIAIIIVSIGFMSGLGEVKDKIEYSFKDYYVEHNVSDFLIKSKRSTGFSQSEIDSFKLKFGDENVMTSFSYDTEWNGQTLRVISQSFEPDINRYRLIDGFLPTSSNEIMVERKTNTLKSFELGETINFMGQDLEVVGIVENPMLIHTIEEPSYLEGKDLDNVIYLSQNPLMPVNDIYITISNRNLFNGFNKKYDNEINRLKSQIIVEDAEILTLRENFGIYSLHYYADKVGTIAIIFVIFFMLVTALVVFSNMTRLLDEERPQIACMKSLGFSNFKIVSKYLIFIALATLIGGALALPVGYGLTRILYSAFGFQYSMPPLSLNMPYFYYLMTFAAIAVSAILVTLFAGLKMTSVKPAVLMTPKAPPIGKRVLLERMPLIWNRLSFKYKSSVRNVFLFKSRFFMTLISIIGSSVLVLAGFGLLDCAIKEAMGGSIKLISAALIIFAGLLSALVIYNIASINISERNREMATLMVLGYHDKEVAGYIYREIYITSVLGALLGLPIGYGFLELVFNLVDFGAVSMVNWWTWLLAPVVTMLFTVLASLLLYKKITRTDMNKSLKTLD